MPVSRKAALLAAAGLMALTNAASSALAGGFQIHEQSAEFQGMSFAGTAAGGSGLSSMFWNPATVTQHSGWKEEWNATAILPYAKAKGMTGGLPGTANSGNIGKTAVVPSSYDTYQINEMFWLGLAINSPYGLATKNAFGSKSANYGYKSKIFTFNINPMVGVKLNDLISFGVGLQINYMKGNLSTDHPTLGITSKIKGHDWGAGFTAGLTLTPTDTTTIGIGYRSRVKHKLKGHFFYVVPGSPPTPFTELATVKHTLPDQLTISLRQQLTDQFALLGTVEWTNWSLLKDFTIVTPTISKSDIYNWKDSWMFSVGGEYKYSDALTLRAGYAYEKSPVPDRTRGVRVPDNDRHWISVGASYVANDWLTMHAGYSHLFVKDGKVNKGLALQANYKGNVNIVSVSATVDPGKFFAALRR